jgi:FkbM family methyltransferase
MMYLDLADEGISHDLIIDGIREANSVETFKQEVKEGDVVVDIGANIGYYALLEARLVGNNGKIYAIEPVRQNVELLRKNIEINGYSNIMSYELAIGDVNGVNSMYITKQRNKHTFREVVGTRKEKYVTGKIDVEVVTLDDFLQNKLYPNVIRMDVEGYEYQIIKGMKNTLQKKLPLKIFVEFHFHLLKQHESIEILETLKDAGFRLADVALDKGLRGLHRYKFLSRIWYSCDTVISKKLNRKPNTRHLNLSIDDILSNPAILSGQWDALHFLFTRS